MDETTGVVAAGHHRAGDHGLTRHRSRLEVDDPPGLVNRAVRQAEENLREILRTFEGTGVRVVIDVHATDHPDPLAVDDYEIVHGTA